MYVCIYVCTRHRSLVSDSVKRNLRFCLNNRGFFHFLLARRFYAVHGVGFKRSWSCSARTSWAPRSPFPSLLNVFTGRPGYFAERRMTLKFSVLMGFIENRVNQVSGVFSQFLIHSVSWPYPLDSVVWRSAFCTWVRKCDVIKIKFLELDV